MSSISGSTGPVTITLDGERLATLADDKSAARERLEPGCRLVMSRFCWLRRAGEHLVAETSLGPGMVALEDPRAQALAAAFCCARELDAELAQAVGLPVESALEVASLLRTALVLLDADAAAAEEEPPLAVWEFHDLLFHSRSRPGRHGNPSGGTYRFLDRFPPASALPSPRGSPRVELVRPDHDQLEREDPPMALVQSRRRSIREYGQTPITLEQLATFLYRVGRVEDYWELPIPGPAPNSMAFVAKAYPSGGALYELEIYAAVSACNGLEPGLYHYASDRHSLDRVSGPTPDVDRVIARGAAGIGIPAEAMQVLLILTTRFHRLAWKYQSIAYALVQKHVESFCRRCT